MTYQVLIQPPAIDDLDAIVKWIAQNSPSSAGRWLDGAFAAIRTLSDFPRGCSLAPEDDAFSEEIRQLLCGDFRILFTIDGDLVRILHVRHGARRPLSPDE